jgi:hypothetical protein
MGWFARYRHTAAIRTEPSKGVATLGCLVALTIFVVVAFAAMRYGTPGWPRQLRLPGPPPPRQWLSSIFWGAGAFAAIALMAALTNGRRWATARRVRRMSEDPALAPYQPQRLEVATRRARVIGRLDVGWYRDRLPRLPQLRRVTLGANVLGQPPLRIAYLRLFENQPRIRTFMQSAWRELGHVHLLRSASSVTPAELRSLRRGREGDLRFIDSPGLVHAHLDRRRDAVDNRRIAAIRGVGPSTIWTFGRYGGYRPRALLCHGAFWKDAVDILLGCVDLVVLDLSGLTEQNAGTLHELRRILDRVPLQRVVFLADPHSNLSYLGGLIGRAWNQMAEGSPNAGPAPRRIEVFRTDAWVRSGGSSQGPDGQRQSTPERVELKARRRHSRRVGVLAQWRVSAR